MTQQTINVGTAANDGTGDPLRSGFVKVNANFTELYSRANLSSSISASPSASQDNYSPSGYSAGVTNRLVLTPTSGGSTINGLLAATDGWSILIVNSSSTDSITFTHQNSSTPANQFSCPGGTSASLPPLTNVIIIYCINQWIFV